MLYVCFAVSRQVVEYHCTCTTGLLWSRRHSPRASSKLYKKSPVSGPKPQVGFDKYREDVLSRYCVHVLPYCKNFSCFMISPHDHPSHPCSPLLADMYDSRTRGIANGYNKMYEEPIRRERRVSPMIEILLFLRVHSISMNCTVYCRLAWYECTQAFQYNCTLGIL